MKKNNKSADCLYKFYFIHSALEYICPFRAVRNADFGLCSVWSTSCPAFATSKISHSTLCSKIKFIFHFINSYCNFMNNLLCYTAACCFLCLDPSLGQLFPFAGFNRQEDRSKAKQSKAKHAEFRRASQGSRHRKQQAPVQNKRLFMKLQ